MYKRSWKRLILCLALASLLSLLLFTRKQNFNSDGEKVEYNANSNEKYKKPEAELAVLKSIEAKAAQAQILMENKSLALVWMNSGAIKYDDPLLVEYVRQTYLIPPDDTKPYNLTSSVSNPSQGQVQSLWPFLQNITDGFFIDCGANNGEFISNTLWLEKDKGWNGLLIEADPTTFAELQTKHRKAWHANLCLSTEKIPKTVPFFRNPNQKNAGVNGLNKRPGAGVTAEIKVQCIPLYTMLLALNRTVIDFFSLDIEGFELEVLKTVPFDKILIKTLAIEHIWGIGGPALLERFMKERGYYLLKKISTNWSQDSIFVRAGNATSNIKTVKHWSIPGGAAALTRFMTHSEELRYVQNN